MISQEELDVAIARWKARRDGTAVPNDAVPQPTGVGYDDAETPPPSIYDEVRSEDEFAGSVPTAEGVRAVPDEAYRPEGHDGRFPRAEDEPTVVPRENPVLKYDWQDTDDEENR